MTCFVMSCWVILRYVMCFMLCYLIIIFDVQHAGNPVHIGFKSNPRVYSSQMVPDAVSQRHTLGGFGK